MPYFDHIISIGAPENSRYGASTAPQRQALISEGRRELMGRYVQKMMAPERSVTVAVHPTPALAQDPYPSLSFSEYGWVAFDADDKRVNDPIGNGPYCMATSDQLPYDIGPAQSVSGWVVLDVPTEHGSVALTMGAPTGWEWSY